MEGPDPLLLTWLTPEHGGGGSAVGRTKCKQWCCQLGPGLLHPSTAPFFSSYSRQSSQGPARASSSSSSAAAPPIKGSILSRALILRFWIWVQRHQQHCTRELRCHQENLNLHFIANQIYAVSVGTLLRFGVGGDGPLLGDFGLGWASRRCCYCQCKCLTAVLEGYVGSAKVPTASRCHIKYPLLVPSSLCYFSWAHCSTEPLPGDISADSLLRVPCCASCTRPGHTKLPVFWQGNSKRSRLPTATARPPRQPAARSSARAQRQREALSTATDSDETPGNGGIGTICLNYQLNSELQPLEVQTAHLLTSCLSWNSDMSSLMKPWKRNKYVK